MINHNISFYKKQKMKILTVFFILCILILGCSIPESNIVEKSTVSPNPTPKSISTPKPINTPRPISTPKSISTPKPISTPRPDTLNPTTLGITVNPTAVAFSKPPEEMTPNEISNLYLDMQNNANLAASIGLKSLALGVSWDEMEPQPLVYNFSSLQDTIERSNQSSRSIELFNFRVIDTTRSTLPADIANQKMDSAEVKQRAKYIVQAIVPIIQEGNVKRFAFGNEINIFLMQNQEQAMNFAWLFYETKQEFNRLLPNIPFGMSVTYEGIKYPDIQEAFGWIIQLGDFVAFTYYPLDEYFKVRSPITATNDIRDMRRIATDYGFSEAILQEIGYPSSLKNNSSQIKQKEFYYQVLKEIKNNQDFFPFACFFMMCDYPEWFVENFKEYYGINDEAFLSFLQTTGTIDGNGNAKESWIWLDLNL